MKRLEFEKILRRSLDYIYSEKKVLITNKTHERTIVAEVKSLIESEFPQFDVQVEYNREGIEGDKKRDIEGRKIVPDLIIHKIGKIQGQNLSAIQFKWVWNPEDRSKDENDLIKLRDRFGYQFLYRVELSTDNYEIIPLVG